jgi:serine/threonine-protein kinase HipA
MNGELVGSWSVDAGGRHELGYSAQWLESSSARPLSLSLPLRSPGTPYRGEIVQCFFDNLLPDSQDIRRRFQRRFGTPTTQPFDLLSEIGRDCAGAIQLLPPDLHPQGLHSIDAEPLKDVDIERLLRMVVLPPALGQRDEDPFRISIAGAQEKTALLRWNGQWHRPRGATPTTHIFKLPLGRVGVMQADMTSSIENEWLCSRIIGAYGLACARCNLASFGSQRALIVERFDRRLSRNGKWWLRLPQEDMCQAMGKAPGLKYEADGGPGMQSIMSLLLGSRNAQDDRQSFFRAQALFWMLCATDGHAKNFSVFLEPGGRYTSTPLYDVLSAYPVLGHGRNRLAPEKARCAMAVVGKNRSYGWSRITRRHWLSAAAACGLGAHGESLIADLINRTPGVIAEVSRALPVGFPGSVAESILAGLRKAADRLAG